MFAVPLYSGFITPTLGAVTTELIANDTVDVDQKTISYNSITGNILIRLATWSNDATPLDVVATWDGVPVPMHIRSGEVGLFWAHAYIFSLFGGSTGTHNIVLDFLNNYRDCVAWIQDIVNPGGVGETGGNKGITSVSTLATDIDCISADSLLVSIGVWKRGDCGPMTLSSPWVSAGDRISATGINDVTAVFGSRTAGAVGTQTQTTNSTTAGPSQAVAILELLPI